MQQGDTYNQRLLELFLQFPSEFHQTFRFIDSTATSQNGSSSVSQELVVYNHQKETNKTNQTNQRWLQFIALVVGSALIEYSREKHEEEEDGASKSPMNTDRFTEDNTDSSEEEVEERLEEPFIHAKQRTLPESSSDGLRQSYKRNLRRELSQEYGRARSSSFRAQESDTHVESYRSVDSFEIEDGIIGALEDEIYDLELDLEEVKRQYKKQKQKNKELTEIFQSHRKEKFAMEQRYAKLKAELAAALADLDNLTLSYESALAEKDLKLLTVTHDCNQQRQHLLRALGEKEKLTKHLGRLEATLEKNRIRLRTLSGERNQANRSLRRSSQAVDALSKKIKKLEQEGSTAAAMEATNMTEAADPTSQNDTDVHSVSYAHRENDGASEQVRKKFVKAVSVGGGLLNNIRQRVSNHVSNAQ